MHLRALVMLCAAALPAVHAFLTTAPVRAADLSDVISGTHAARVAPRVACRQGVVSLKVCSTRVRQAMPFPLNHRFVRRILVTCVRLEMRWTGAGDRHEAGVKSSVDCGEGHRGTNGIRPEPVENCC